MTWRHPPFRVISCLVARYYDVLRQSHGKWLFTRRADEYIGWEPPA